jgi:hypothetical protein
LKKPQTCKFEDKTSEEEVLEDEGETLDCRVVRLTTLEDGEGR